MLENALGGAYQALPVTIGYLTGPNTEVEVGRRAAARVLGDPLGGAAIAFGTGVETRDVTCMYGTFTAGRAIVVGTPSGRVMLTCHFSGLPQIRSHAQLEGFACGLQRDGLARTASSVWKRTPAGTALMRCTFDGGTSVSPRVVRGLRPTSDSGRVR